MAARASAWLAVPLPFINEQLSRTVVGVVVDVRGFDLAMSVPEWIDGAMYVPHGPNATIEDGAFLARAGPLDTLLDPPAPWRQRRTRPTDDSVI